MVMFGGDFGGYSERRLEEGKEFSGDGLTVDDGET